MNKLALALICIGMVFGVVYVSQANDWQRVDSERLASCIVGNPPPPTDCVNDDGTPCDEANKCCEKADRKFCMNTIDHNCAANIYCPDGHVVYDECLAPACKSTSVQGSICTSPSTTYTNQLIVCTLNDDREACPDQPGKERCKRDFNPGPVSYVNCNAFESLCSSQPFPKCQ